MFAHNCLMTDLGLSYIRFHLLSGYATLHQHRLVPYTGHNLRQYRQIIQIHNLNLKPKSAIRPTMGGGKSPSIAIAFLSAVLLPVLSRHSSLCLRQHGCNPTNMKAKRHLKSNGRFGINCKKRKAETSKVFAAILSDYYLKGRMITTSWRNCQVPAINWRNINKH